MTPKHYDKEILERYYYKGGFKGDWIVGLVLMAIIVLVIVS